jgi:hypothetical protein
MGTSISETPAASILRAEEYIPLVFWSLPFKVQYRLDGSGMKSLWWQDFMCSPDQS